MKKNNLLWYIFAIALIIVYALWFFFDDSKHIEDTNGHDNRLNTITEHDIKDMTIPGKGLKYEKKQLSFAGIESNTMTFYSDMYSGIEEICYADYILPSDCTIEINDFKITAGNFRLVVVNEGVIIASIEPNNELTGSTYTFENIKGHISIRLVGESASFSLTLSQSTFDLFEHPMYE